VEHYAVRALKAGASGYLCKEMAPEELTDAVHTVLEGRIYLSECAREKVIDNYIDQDKVLHDKLSNRELHVFSMLVQGKSLQDIATRLNIGLTSVYNYRNSVLGKLEVKTNADLMRYHNMYLGARTL
jgi:DNA-binding NarL/FixJ family response regulator